MIIRSIFNREVLLGHNQTVDLQGGLLIYRFAVIFTVPSLLSAKHLSADGAIQPMRGA